MENNNNKLNIEYVLARLDKILEQNNHISEVMDSINNMEINNSYHGGLGDQARAEAIARVVISRETTNQRILDLLNTMYGDLKSNNIKN